VPAQRRKYSRDGGPVADLVEDLTGYRFPEGGVVAWPTIPGVELYLWAMGNGQAAVDTFLSSGPCPTVEGIDIPPRTQRLAELAAGLTTQQLSQTAIAARPTRCRPRTGPVIRCTHLAAGRSGSGRSAGSLLSASARFPERGWQPGRSWSALAACGRRRQGRRCRRNRSM
jgi:hypothetical protein